MSKITQNSCLLSVICPVYNEVDHIEKLLHFFVSSLPKEKEMYLIDGGSDDGTIEIIRKWEAEHENIVLLHNEHQYVPYALNKAIPLCRGKYIVRLDAHTDYEGDYFEQILAAFEKSKADVVGGPTRTKKGGKVCEAVAYVISTPLGIGDSRVHQEDYEGFTDSVTFGAWRREIFDKVGFFDVRLRRNQDDEFHYRAKSMGLTIYQTPLIKLYYYPRTTFKALFRQYFQYGLYKPIVLRKVPKEAKLRHFIPSLFVIYLLLLPLLLGWSFLFAVPFFLYFLLVFYYSLFNHLPCGKKIRSFFVYPVLHVAYGAGFLFGIGKLWAR